MNRILIIIGDASETVDTLYPYLRVQEEGIVPVVAAPEKRRYEMVLHEVKPGWTITMEYPGYTIEADVAFRDVVPEEYLGIFFSGGRAPEYIRYDEDRVRITRHFFDANKPVGCVWHGVEIPAYAGCVKGRRMATVPKCRYDLDVCGGIFVNEPCVIDGNLVSGRTWHDHDKYMKLWVEPLKQARGGRTPNPNVGSHNPENWNNLRSVNARRILEFEGLRKSRENHLLFFVEVGV